MVRVDPDDRPIGGTGGRGEQKIGNMQFNSHEDRPINATGQYDLSAIPLDEIEFDTNYSEVE